MNILAILMSLIERTFIFIYVYIICAALITFDFRHFQYIEAGAAQPCEPNFESHQSNTSTRNYILLILRINEYYFIYIFMKENVSAARQTIQTTTRTPRQIF